MGFPSWGQGGGSGRRYDPADSEDMARTGQPTCSRTPTFAIGFVEEVAQAGSLPQSP
jgi:hypothetical protein